MTTPNTDTLAQALTNATDQHDSSLLTLSHQRPLLLALLRHTGCPFCVEALDDLRKAKADIDATNTAIAVVFQTGEPEFALKMLERYELHDAHLVLDPEQALYDALDIKNGNLWQIFGPHVILRVFQVLAKGLRPYSKAHGSTFRLPGTALIHNGKVLRSHVHRSQADRANYSQVCQLPTPA